MIVPFVLQNVGSVAYVVEALVIVPFVLVNVGAVTKPDALMLNTDEVEVYTLNGVVEVD